MMSCDLSTEIWLLKEDLLSKYVEDSVVLSCQVSSINKRFRIQLQMSDLWILHCLGLLRDVEV